jgi:hypothetical protein
VRNAVVQLPELRSEGDQRKVLRVAVRQLERADLYLAAVESLEIRDHEVRHALVELRASVEALRRHLVDERARLAV